MPKRRVDVIEEAAPYLDEAIRRGLMQATITARSGKRVVLEDGREVTEFVNCSYLGLDVHQDVVQAAADVVREWGVHFCCARSRFTIAPNRDLEAALSSLFRGHALTFPSVTSAHLAVLPLVASGALLPGRTRSKVRIVFDRHAHASMQSLKPLLREEASVVTIGHDDLDALARTIDEAHAAGEDVVYVADSVYSMGGVCPLDRVRAIVDATGSFLYLDDAHGTSIFGAHGEGYVLSRTDGPLPRNTILAFSLAKGFGCNGGGVVLPTEEQRRLVRSHGSTYAFSAPLDFSVVAAALASVRLHDDGTVRALQERLWRKVALYDSLVPERHEGLSPIRMVPMRSRDHALDAGAALLARGFFASVALYPVVAVDQPQLRVCIAVDHEDDDVRRLCTALEEVRA